MQKSASAGLASNLKMNTSKLILFFLSTCIANFCLCMDHARLKKIIFVVGPAGSGKTTASTAFAQENNKYCGHYSVGNLLREKAQDETELGKLIKGMLDRADIVPLEVGMRVVEDAIASETKSLLLIDGFPPTRAYMDAFEQLMRKNSNIKLLGVIAFEIDQDTAEQRVLGRCRADDKRDNFAKRYHRYKQNCPELFACFSKYGLSKVDACQSFDRVKQSFLQSVLDLQK